MMTEWLRRNVVKRAHGALAGASHVSIRTKLSIAFGFALALVVAVGLFGLMQLHSVFGVTRNVTDVLLPRLEQLGVIKRTIIEHRLLATRRAQTTNFHQLAAIAQSMEADVARAKEIGGSYLNSGISADEREIYSEFDGFWRDYLHSLQDVQQRIEMGEIAGALREFNDVSRSLFDSAVAKLDNLLARSKETSEIATAKARTFYQIAFLLTLAVIGFAAVLTAAAIVWVSRQVSSPILRISDAMKRLTVGDEAVIIEGEHDRGDEIGILVKAVLGYRDSLVLSRQLAEAAETEHQRLLAAVGHMPIGLCMFDANQRLFICNARYTEMYRLPSELSRPGTPLADMLEARIEGGLYSGSDPQRYASALLRTVSEGRPALTLAEMNDGRVFSIIHQPMKTGGWVSTHEDVTERRKAEARIHHMARHDPLTDLPNRRLFRERVDHGLKRIAREGSLAVLCVDLDRFKSVNDTLGHPVGDLLLKVVAARLRSCVGETDTVARFGGDEFAIVQIGAASQPAGATALAERIIDVLSAPYEVDGHNVVIGASVGIAIAPIDGQTADQLMRNGDMALYRSKCDGRGTYRFFETEMDARMQARRILELDLRRALLKEEFAVYYQPILNAHKGEVIGFEALLRWKHPTRGMVPPGEFIPLAEEIGLIIPIGEWVLRRACRDATAWPDHIKLAVNLSPAQFRNRKILETVMTALAVSNFPARRLELEITEGVLLVDHEATLALLHQLRALGVSIAMDDFGTGYSSLSYLRSFPFDKIKIDQSFIARMAEDRGSAAIIRAVTGLGASLGIVTTAEGVETADQLARVRAEGCNEVQGFLFSEARPAEELKALLAAPIGKMEAA